MTEAESKALVRRWFDEVWNKGLESAIDALFPDHAVAHGLGDRDSDVRGPKEFKIFESKMRGAFPDIHITIEDIVAEDDKVMVRWVLEGTHTGGHLGTAATGRKVRVSGMVLLRVSNHQIHEGWNSWDQLGLLRQIGALPATEQQDRFLAANG